MNSTDKFTYEVITPGKIVPRITIINSGGPRDGKTSFMLSGPGPYAVLSNDVNTRIICEKESKKGKKIYFKEMLKRPTPALSIGTTVEEQNAHKRYWKEFRDAYYRFLEMKDVRTIGLETGGRMYEDARYAYLGRPRIDVLAETNGKGEQTETRISIEKVAQRDYGPVKDEIRDMINDCSATGKNLIVNHWDKDEYVNNVRTGRRIPDGLIGISYLGQAETWQYRDRDTGEFRIVLMNSTANGDIRGRRGDYQVINGITRYVPGPDELVGEEVNFAMVATAIYPDSDFELWS
jgi:hypothetical protein